MTEAYLPDTPYLATFIPEVAPAWLDRAALTQGVRSPRRAADAPFRYCDLGCGFGVTTNILAASTPSGSFVGIDALAEHTDWADALARAAGIPNVEFQALRFDQALEARLEPFDYIVAQGVYTWVSREVREQLLVFVERHLAPGGLFFLSYNAMPGWARWLPAQALLKQVGTRAAGDAGARFESAADRILVMRDAKARAFVQNPALDTFDDRLKNMPAGYLVHEYLTTAWEPAWSTDVLGAAEARRLAFVGTAIEREQRPEFFLRKAQRELLADEPDPGVRELMKDLFLDTKFRRDLFSPTPIRTWHDTDAIFEARARQHFVLTPTEGEKELQLKTPAGTLKFDNAAARAFLGHLTGGPGTPRDCARAHPEATVADVVNSADALWAAGRIWPVDPSVEGLDLTAVQNVFDELAERGEFYSVEVIPNGTALPVASDASFPDAVDPTETQDDADDPTATTSGMEARDPGASQPARSRRRGTG